MSADLNSLFAELDRLRNELSSTRRQLIDARAEARASALHEAAAHCEKVAAYKHQQRARATPQDSEYLRGQVYALNAAAAGIRALLAGSPPPAGDTAQPGAGEGALRDAVQAFLDAEHQERACREAGIPVRELKEAKERQIRLLARALSAALSEGRDRTGAEGEDAP